MLKNGKKKFSNQFIKYEINLITVNKKKCSDTLLVEPLVRVPSLLQAKSILKRQENQHNLLIDFPKVLLLGEQKI